MLPTTPLRVHGTDVAQAVASPRVGQHNDEILRALALSDDDVAALIDGDIVNDEEP